MGGMAETYERVSLSEERDHELTVEYLYASGTHIELVMRTSIIEVHEDGKKVAEVYMSDLPSILEQA